MTIPWWRAKRSENNGARFSELEEALQRFPAVYEYSDLEALSDVVDRVAAAYGIKADHCWFEMSIELCASRPALSSWLLKAAERWEEIRAQQEVAQGTSAGPAV